MAAAAGTSLLRSVASKIARAPPLHHRLIALGFHGRRLGPSPPVPRTASHLLLFSSSRAASTSTPPPTNTKGPLNGFDWHSAMRNRTNMACFLVFCGMIYMHGCMKSALQEFRESFATASRERSKMADDIRQAITHDCQRLRDLLLIYDESKDRNTEATDVLPNYSKAQNMQS